MAHKPRGKELLRLIKRDKFLILLVTPAILYYIIFCYTPMYGVQIAFRNYNPAGGFTGSPFVGLQWFREFFTSIFAFRVIRNTVIISLLSLCFGFTIPIIYALILNEAKNKVFKKFVQTASYLPHFISVVIVVGILMNLFATNGGIVNIILTKLFHIEPINFMGSAEWFRRMFVGSNVWQNFGYNSIIYLAAISAVDPQLYEASVLDGAGRIRQIISITIPSIAPTIIIVFILALGSIMNVSFEKIILMYSPATYETSDVISTYVYRRGIISGEYSFASAVGLFNSAINCTLLLIFNRISAKVTEISLF